MGAWGMSPQPLGNFCNFSEKSKHFNAVWMTFCTFLEQLEKAKLLRWGPGGKAPSHWAILAIFQKKVAILTSFR